MAAWKGLAIATCHRGLTWLSAQRRRRRAKEQVYGDDPLVLRYVNGTGNGTGTGTVTLRLAGPPQDPNPKMRTSVRTRTRVDSFR
jgi:hypothetical protein